MKTRKEVMQRLLDLIDKAHDSVGAGDVEAYARAYEALARCEQMSKVQYYTPAGLVSGSALQDTP